MCDTCNTNQRIWFFTPSLLSTLLSATAQKRKTKEQQPQDAHTNVASEVKVYLSSAESVLLDSDSLHWWFMHSNSFPTLSKLAKKYLYIQASSVSSERLFSISGNIVSKKTLCFKTRVNQQNGFSCLQFVNVCNLVMEERLAKLKFVLQHHIFCFSLSMPARTVAISYSRGDSIL